jgi:hypothetical protein
MSRKPKNKGKTKVPQPPPPSSTGNPFLPKLFTWLAIALIMVALVSRIFLGDIAMTRDEGMYGYLGQLAIRGFIPYVDFYEMKPPALFYLYGLGGTLFGFTDMGLRLFSLLVNAVSCLMIYLILQRHISRLFAFIAVVLFALLSTNPFAFGFAMVAEHLVSMFVLVSLYFVQKNNEDAGLKYILIAGAAFGLAILTKQTAIIFSLVFLVYFIVERRKKAWLRQTILYAAGVMIPTVVVLLLLGITGSLDEAFYWMIKYPSLYSAAVTMEEGMTLFSYFFRKISTFQITIFIVTCLAIIYNLIFNRSKPNNRIFIYFLLALVSILPGFRFYGQYWLLMFVPMAMLTGTALNHVSSIKLSYGTGAVALILVLIIFELVRHKDYYFFRDESATIHQLYNNNPFDPIRKLSKYAGARMKEDEDIMVFGSEPQVYLYTGKEAPTRHIFMSMISRHDNNSKLLIREAMEDAEREKPEYVLFSLFPYSWGLNTAANDELYKNAFRFVIRNYDPIAAYQMSQNSYLYTDSGDVIDPKMGNQVILFKLR